MSSFVGLVATGLGDGVPPRHRTCAVPLEGTFDFAAGREPSGLVSVNRNATHASHSCGWVSIRG